MLFLKLFYAVDGVVQSVEQLIINGDIGVVLGDEVLVHMELMFC